MKIEGTHTIRASRERLWLLLTDPAVLERCVPGCEALETTEDGGYRMTLKAGVGSIKGTFTGAIRLEDMREPEHYRMLVDGKGSPGFLKGAGTLDLAEQDGETTIDYAGDVSVGGTIASVGQRMILSSAKLMAGQFFRAIAAEAAALQKALDTGEPYEPPKHGLIRNALRGPSDRIKRLLGKS
jgi:carbon monoxide dehydrogenase subunit G